MKKSLILTCAVFFMIIHTYSQSTVELTFTALNNEQHIALDSIFIENLTQGGDTTLYAPDTVLELDYASDINSKALTGENIFSVSQNYPNPFQDKTVFNLNLLDNEEIKITVQDVIAREIANYQTTLSRGNHSLVFYAAKEKYYMLTVTVKHARQTIKMLSTGSQSNKVRKCEIVYMESIESNTGYKSINAKNGFVFNIGDELKYTAFSGIGEVSLNDTPGSNQIYTFQFAGIPCPGTPTLTDIEGNVYNTVLIGSQCWMKENLKTTFYSNGVPIPNEPDNNAWSNLWTSAFVWYNNDTIWKDLYGVLYNGWAIHDTNQLCPTGWHMPTYDEWTILTDFIGGINSPHGNELKSCKQVNSPQGGDCNTTEHPRWEENISNWGTDDFGFSGFPGGFRDINGSFDYLGTYGLWWTASPYSGTSTWHRGLYFNGGDVYLSTWSNRNGFSVRCIRD